MAQDPWDKFREKKWNQIYLRSEKLHRAKQLNMDYPRNSGREQLAAESINVLFICSKNQWRSPTAEKVFGKHPLINARSAGTNKHARRVVSSVDIKWADLILAMEEKHRDRLLSTFPDDMKYKDCGVLNIPDDYKYMDEDLIAELFDSVEPILTL